MISNEERSMQQNAAPRKNKSQSASLMFHLEKAEKSVAKLQRQKESLLLDNKELARGMRRMIKENKRLRERLEGTEDSSTCATRSTTGSMDSSTCCTCSDFEDHARHLANAALGGELQWYRHMLNETLTKLAAEESTREELARRLASSSLGSIEDTSQLPVPSRDNIEEEQDIVRKSKKDESNAPTSQASESNSKHVSSRDDGCSLIQGKAKASRFLLRQSRPIDRQNSPGPVK
jgi:hypothetical protein